MKKLFMVTLGGKAKNATIEVHDLQFIIAKDINETYAILKNNWYGTILKLHIDAHKVINGADGFSVSISDNEPPQKSNNNLYFVNIGGYNKELMSELHNYCLVVATDLISAKKKALDEFKDRYVQVHVDNIYKVENCKLLNSLYSGTILLTSSDKNYNLKPDWFGYKRIDNL